MDTNQVYRGFYEDEYTVTTQPYVMQMQNTAQPERVNVIVDQPRASHVTTFVDQIHKTKRMHLQTEKNCLLYMGLLRLCFRKKLHLKTMDGTPLGYVEYPITPKSFDHSINVKTPDNNIVMQTIHEPDCWERFAPCCYLCDDHKLMDIYGPEGERLGSFEYSPRFCRCEPHCCCCHGKYIVKNKDTIPAMYLPRRSCCCPCILSLNIFHCVKIPIVICYGNSAVAPVVQKWILPVEMRSTIDDSVVSRLRMVRKTFFQELCCCIPPQYILDFEKENESEANKLLILGSSIAVDFYNLPLDVFNSSDITYPAEFEEYDL